MRRHVWPGRLRLGAAWGGALVLMSGLLWAVSWYYPQPPVDLVLVGAGYQENLAVPHNSCGWRGLADLSKLGDEEVGTKSNFHVLGNTTQIDGAFGWQEIVRKSSQDVVLVISAHGAADEQGPYLIPNGFTTSQPQRIRLEKLWTELAALPPDQQKLVIFDVTQVAGDWRLGFLDNGFVRSLAAESDRIKAIDNLTVFCSSDVNERSWVEPAVGRTIFMHHLRIALQGHATDLDRNGRIDVAELHTYVSDNVSAWVAKHRGVKQQPLLLPRGTEGMYRAKRFDLTLAQGPAKPQTAAGDIAESRQQVRDTWKHYEELLATAPRVHSTGPTYWREYVDTLLRYEQLERVGDREFAERMRQRLAGIEYRMRRERTQAHASQQNSLSLYHVTQAHPLPHANATRTLDELWAAEPADRSNIWQKAIKANADEAENAERLRLAVFDALFSRATENPAANLKQAAEIAEVVRSPQNPLPAELHFLAMLAKYLPTDTLTPAGSPQIQQALRLRRLAERAAVGHHDGDIYAAEQALPWFTAHVQAGDQKRRLGEDLLFAGTKDRSRATDYFLQAKQSYDQALENAEYVEAALQTCDKVLAQLPYYSQWLADATLDPYVANARHEDTLEQAERLWEQTHRLAAMLEQPNASWIAAAPPPSSDWPQPLSLIDQHDLVEAEFDELVKQYEQIITAIAGGVVIPHWHTAERALHVPHADWQLRLKLLEKLHAHQHTLAGEDGFSPAMTDAAEVVSHRTSSRAVATTNARWQGRMALATLGRRTFREMRDANAEDYQQVWHRLNVFKVEQQWWDSTGAAAREIFSRYAELPNRIAAAVKRSETESESDSYTDLTNADRWARAINGAQASQLKSRPSVAFRRAVLQKLAVNLASRTWNDHWYALDPQDDPYFRVAGLAYLNDAQRLRPGGKQLAAVRKELVAESSLQFIELQPLDLTSEQNISLTYVFQAQGEQPASQGYPVSWLDSGDALELLQPAAGERIVRHVGQTRQGGNITVAIRSQPLQEAERSTHVKQAQRSTQLKVHGFFRGQVMEQDIPVTLHLRPEIAQFEHPLPKLGAVSLSANTSITNQFGTGDGAIAFVVDCSGSMGPTRGENDPTKSKYAEAVNALREVLAQVPRGTNISLWTFGQQSARANQSPEESIRQLQPPIEWDPTNSDLQQQLMAKLDPHRVRPWNESPIVRTILAAKEDLTTAEGFKTILVITDGMDNRFHQDRVVNPAGKSIPQALQTALAETGIALNVVAFKVAGGEEEKVQQQFSITEQLFPAGKLVYVDDTAALAETLALALGHRMRFQLSPYDSPLHVASQEIGRDGSDVWSPAPLSAGTLQLRVSTQPPLQTDVTLNPGDLLSLELVREDGRFVVRRKQNALPLASSRRRSTVGSWQATVLQNQISSDQTLRLALALDTKSTGSETFITQITPRRMWIEAQPSSGNSNGIAWQRLLGYPASAWSITAEEWPLITDGTGLAQPQLRAWWSLDADVPYSAALKRNHERPTVAELAGVALRTASESVMVESVAVEEHYVTIAPGQRAKRPCLVVRLTSKPGQIYWAELQGLQPAGTEQRFYPSIGKYTGLFWPVTRAEVDRGLRGLGIVSLDVFKREAESQNSHIQFDSLAAPDANDILPTPSFSLE